MWCKFGHVTFKRLNQRNPRTPPCGRVQGAGCSGSEAGSHLSLIDFVYHSTLGLRVIKKKKGSGLRHHHFRRHRETRLRVDWNHFERKVDRRGESGRVVVPVGVDPLQNE